jgi:hypothetical protein
MVTLEVFPDDWPCGGGLQDALTIVVRRVRDITVSGSILKL